jgi:hypothetical protein
MNAMALALISQPKHNNQQHIPLDSKRKTRNNIQVPASVAPDLHVHAAAAPRLDQLWHSMMADAQVLALW